MRILVVSDMHRRKSNFEKVLERHSDIDEIFFLGDGVDDAEEISSFFKGKRFTLISGNCDFLSKYPSTVMCELCGVKILATHGHTYSVKSGTQNLLNAALENGVRLAIYGHTHIQKAEYIKGVHIICPGALGGGEGGPGYAIIDVTPNGIVPNLLRL